MTPVTYSAASQLIVKTFEALPAAQQTAIYWNEPVVSPVRGEIKDHYIKEQKFICIYCGQTIITANKSLWDAEHIISRSKAPRFLFNPRNLAISCRDCNIAKGETEIRKNPDRKSLAVGSQHYLIVHPHYDNYNEHILWIGPVCCPISKKGVKTQTTCNLTRFSAELIGLGGIITDPNYYALIGRLLCGKNVVEVQAAIAGISVYVANIPQT